MKQLISLRLLFLFLATMVCGSSSAGSLISEIAVSAAAKGKNNEQTAANVAAAKAALTNRGYSLIDFDTNKGAGGSSYYVYIGYKTTDNPSEAISLIAIVSKTADGKKFLGGVQFNNKSYDLYLADCYEQSNGDLNQKAGGSYLYLFYSKSHNTKQDVFLYSGLTVSYDFGNGVPYYDYEKGALSQRDAVTNLNRGLGKKGDDIYLIAPKHYHDFLYEFVNDAQHKYHCRGCRLDEKFLSHSSQVNEINRDDTHHWGMCNVCNHVVGKQEHIYMRSSTTTEEHSRVCSVCHLLINDKHQFGSFTPVDETQHMYVCCDPVCGYSHTLPHTWGDSTTIIVPATCDHVGIIEYYCNDCHISHRETIPELPNNSGLWRKEEEDDDTDINGLTIDTIIEEQPADELLNVYSLQGYCVMRQVTRSEALQQMIPGVIYMMNGKRVIRNI